MTDNEKEPIWSLSTGEILKLVSSSNEGLNTEECVRRQTRYGHNALAPAERAEALRVLLKQFKSPLILILIITAILSFVLHDPTNAVIILVIILVSGGLSFWQEYRASSAVKGLLQMLRPKTRVIRDNNEKEIPTSEIVPGDVVLLSAGDSIPADCVVLEAKDLYVNESSLTGETYPAYKSPGAVEADTPLSKRTNMLFTGTNVASGEATALVFQIGKQTEFGKLAEHLKMGHPETEFEHGLRRFGYFLMEVTLFLVVIIFAINVYLDRPVIEAFLFSLALAVGLTPQLLPSIVSVNLAHGAREMARNKVIVRHLPSIENFGSMNVLCCDKTGTLTEGVVELNSYLNVDGQQDEKVLFYAYLNSSFERGFVNPIDKAIRRHRQLALDGYRKLDEVPYDFLRKRLSVLVAGDQGSLMVTKGAVGTVLGICSKAKRSESSLVDMEAVSEQVLERFNGLSADGFRCLAVAYKRLDKQLSINIADEADMTFLGLITFFDPPKLGVADTIRHLKEIGVSLKVITGDNSQVAAYVGGQLGLSAGNMITGSQLRQLNDEALVRRVNDVDIFAEIEPNQKERVVLSLRKAGNVTGFMGDGINDASALHAADVGISVDQAVQVAKEAADIVLLKKDLAVLLDGVRLGRVTFANTLKYVFMATSANFGNMFSMAGASLFLPFLPLLPKQILFTNLLTDLPEMAIATDSVDPETTDRPRRWDMVLIRRFMLVFGLLSSVFDFMTFACLLLLLRVTQEQFRTGWFVESVVSATLIVLVVRTRRSLAKSRPSKYVLVATMAVITATLLLPFTHIGQILGFQPLPLWILGILAVIVVTYIAVAEIVKKMFYRKIKW
ncbi:MAG: magnesium-translocating P-type ATPase [Phycisphaerae bacterium]|nr:magnesium-translocating P-type ATPase [Phycisphaerae bacterium]